MRASQPPGRQSPEQHLSDTALERCIRSAGYMMWCDELPGAAESGGVRDELITETPLYALSHDDLWLRPEPITERLA